MRSFILYLKDYFRNTPRINFLLTIVFTGTLVLMNYTVGIEGRIRALSPWPLSLGVFFLFYFMVFGFAYILQTGFLLQARSILLDSSSLNKMTLQWSGIPRRREFLLLLLLAPLLFACKMVHWDLSFITGPVNRGPWSRYWLILLQLPVKLLFIIGILYACRKWLDNRRGEETPGFYGLSARDFSLTPYFQILLLMAPVIALAALRPDFQHAYPKMKNVFFMDGIVHPAWPWRLLFELSYGLDFVSIELFFRGFLVLGFLKYAGRHAILPMAAFYCTIHFGKPLGECISSFFGGLVLGVIASRTRTVLGGLVVHLGVAWMMELF